MAVREAGQVCKKSPEHFEGVKELRAFKTPVS